MTQLLPKRRLLSRLHLSEFLSHICPHGAHLSYWNVFPLGFGGIFFPLLLWPLLVSLFFGVFFLFLVPKSVFKCSTLRTVHLSLSTVTHVHGLGTIHISASQLGAILSPRGHLSISGNYSIVTTWGMCYRHSEVKDVGKYPIVHRLLLTAQNYLAQDVNGVKVVKP